MFKRRVLELKIAQIRLPYSGRDGGGESRHLVSLALIWPRMAIAHKTVNRPVAFLDGLYRPDPDCWTETILFKEAVEGPFGLRIEISEALNDAQWSETLARLGQSIWSFAGAQIIDMTESPVAALLWKAPFDGLVRTAAAAAKQDPRPVAAGSLDLQCETWQAMQATNFKIKMTAPSDLTRLTRHRVSGKLQSRRKVVLRAGQDNGEAEVTGRVYR